MYAEINPNVNYNKALPYDGMNSLSNYEETPMYSKYQEIHGKNSKFSENYCGGASTLAIGGLQMENTPVSLMFFSDENIARINKQIKKEIFDLSRGAFRLEVDQDESDLLLAMRYVYLEYSKNLPTHIVRQVKILNRELLNYIIPDMMTNIKQHYGYLKEISEPIKPMEQPLNVNKKGRKTLPSITTLWR